MPLNKALEICYVTPFIDFNFLKAKSQLDLSRNIQSLKGPHQIILRSPTRRKGKKMKL